MFLNLSDGTISAIKTCLAQERVEGEFKRML